MQICKTYLSKQFHNLRARSELIIGNNLYA